MPTCNICRTAWRDENIKMFHVPVNPQKRQQWNKACGRILKDNTFICEIHFLKSDIVLRDKRRRLKSNALPILSLHPAANSKPRGVENENFLFDNDNESWEYGDGSGSQKNCNDGETETEHTLTDSVLSNNEEQEETNEIIESALKATTFQFINEALFDETTNVNTLSSNATAEKGICSRKRCSKSVQTGNDELRTCGFIEVAVNTKIYNMRCFYCPAIMPIYSWTKFVTHIKENHQNIEEIYLKDEDIYADMIDETSAANENADDAASENSRSNIKKEEVIKTEIYPTECQQVSHKVQQIKNAEVGQLISCIEENTIEPEDKGECKVDEIRLGQTDGAIVMDFIELFEKHPVLWPLLPESKEKYDAAVLKVMQLLNNKWQLNIRDFSMRASLNRIKIWYKNVCARGCKNIKSGYLQYFHRCEKFLSNTINEHIRKFVCEICKNYFMDEIHLQVHQYKRHQMGELPYKCRLCARGFEKPELLERHEKFHNREKKFACSDCGKCFYHEKHFKAHMKVHQICEFCGKKSTSKAMYNMHRITHEPPRHICTICSKGYFRRERLLEHIKAHRNERDYVCEECGKAFIRQRALACHKQSVHSDVRAYVCRICDSSFKTPNGLYIHRKTHHLVLEGSIEQLMKQMKTGLVYNKHTYVIDPQTQRRRLVCDICGNTYSRHAGLNVHKINAHGWVPLKERRKLKLAAEKKIDMENFSTASNEETVNELTEKSNGQEEDIESDFEETIEYIDSVENEDAAEYLEYTHTDEDLENDVNGSIDNVGTCFTEDIITNTY